MDFESIPSDPAVRILLLGSIIRRERRLIFGVLLAMIITLSVWLQTREPHGGPWDGAEIQNMSGLPLNPAPALLDGGEVTQEEIDAFRQIQEGLKR